MTPGYTHICNKMAPHAFSYEMRKEFQKWVRRYQDDAWSLARYLLQDASEAEDATQEAFIKLWQNGRLFGLIPAKCITSE